MASRKSKKNKSKDSTRNSTPSQSNPQADSHRDFKSKGPPTAHPYPDSSNTTSRGVPHGDKFGPAWLKYLQDPGNTWTEKQKTALRQYFLAADAYRKDLADYADLKNRINKCKLAGEALLAAHVSLGMKDCLIRSAESKLPEYYDRVSKFTKVPYQHANSGGRITELVDDGSEDAEI